LAFTNAISRACLDISAARPDTYNPGAARVRPAAAAGSNCAPRHWACCLARVADVHLFADGGKLAVDADRQLLLPHRQLQQRLAAHRADRLASGVGGRRRSRQARTAVRPVRLCSCATWLVSALVPPCSSPAPVCPPSATSLNAETAESFARVPPSGAVEPSEFSSSRGLSRFFITPAPPCMLMSDMYQNRAKVTRVQVP
jgi:hypothetical protein